MFGLGVQNETGQRLTEFCQENTLVIANTLFQQPKRWLHTRTSPYDQHQNQTDYILCSWKWSSIQLLKHWAFLTAQQIKNPPAMQETKGGTGSILGSGRSPGGGNGNPLQYSCLKNPMDIGIWQATVQRTAKESDKTEYTCVIHYTVSKNKTWSLMWLRSWAPYCKIQS